MIIDKMLLFGTLAMTSSGALAYVVDTKKPPQMSANRPEDCTFDLTLYKSLGLPPFHSFEEGLAMIADEVKASL